MKNDFSVKKLGAYIRMGAKRFRKALTHNFWLKLLSLILAILLWNYVVSNNKDITRSKTITGIEGLTSGQSSLAAYGLALPELPSESISDFTVRVEVAQSDYSRVKAENIKVMLDFSNVRAAGVQEIPFRATTAFGRVTEIIPEGITVNVEPIDSRSIPVSVRLVNEKGDKWYSVARTNPASLTITGAASVVRRIAQARVESDVSEATSSYVRAESYELLDIEGNVVPQDMLTRSASSATVMTDIYPKREINISKEIDSVVTGHLPKGYKISGITLQPEAVTVAAEEELLSSLTELYIEPVSVEGHTQSFSARAKLSKLTGIKYFSAEEVYVTVTIEEAAPNAAGEESDR